MYSYDTIVFLSQYGVSTIINRAHTSVLCRLDVNARIYPFSFLSHSEQPFMWFKSSHIKSTRIDLKLRK